MNPAWLPGGYLGVDMFFVISGFVITQALQNNKQSFWQFWLNRFFRIFPAYGVMLTVVATIAALIFLPENFKQFTLSWQSCLLFLSNQYFATYGDYFSPLLTEQPLLHTWSLAVEMQFYLLYPILLAACLKLRATWFLAALTLLGFVIAQWTWKTSESTTALYYAFYVRAPEFLLGCTLASYAVVISSKVKKLSRPIAYAGIVVIAVALFFAKPLTFTPAVGAIICIGIALIILAQVNAGVLALIVNHRVTLLLGAMSYSIYLWHWPILAFARYMLVDFSWVVLSGVVYFVAVLIVGWLSWAFIENKFRLQYSSSIFGNIKKLFILFVISVAPLSYANHLSKKPPVLYDEYTRYADGQIICHGQILTTCLRGRKSDDSTILVIGDSHAAQLNLAFDVVGAKLGLEFEVITASSCVPIVGFNVDKLPESAKKPCQDQMDAVSKKIPLAKQIIIAGMWSYQFQDEKFPSVLMRFLDGATSANQSVLILAQLPKLKRNPRRVERLRYWGLDIPNQINDDWQLANAQLLEVVKKYPLVRYVDLSRSDMFQTLPFNNGLLIYFDDHHLNEVGSNRYGQVLADALRPQLSH